jgi:hypothetical protein
MLGRTNNTEEHLINIGQIAKCWHSIVVAFKMSSSLESYSIKFHAVMINHFPVLTNFHIIFDQIIRNDLIKLNHKIFEL